MPTTRRGFIRQVLSVGPVAMAFWIETDFTDFAWAQGGAECTLPNPGTPTRFIPNEAKVLTRYSAAEIADPSRKAQLDRFKEAIGLVRALPSTDVISWTKQIAQHCTHCASSNTQNVHYDWQFLPWHRGLLYFLERILRKLKGDDLRLVYWDWENPASGYVPSIYLPTGQPLYWANRNLSPTRWPLKPYQVDVQPLLAIPSFADFGGTARQRTPTPAAYSGPHAQVHNNFSPGDMANLQYSPRDPVFYAHHGNIDRLWSSWVAAGHTNPDFGDARVYFYDENRVWRYVLMNDLRDEAKLGYKYSSLMQPKASTKKLRALALPKTGNRLSIETPTLQSMKAPGPEFLLVQNIDLSKMPANAVLFGIFADQPAAGADGRADKGFLGTASRVLSEGHNHNGPLSAAFEVTGKLAAMSEQGKGAVQLFIAPMNLEGKTTAAAAPLVAENVKLID